MTPQTKGSMYVKAEDMGSQEGRGWGERDSGEKEGAYESKDVNGFTGCGLNKCVIVREDYTSVLQHSPPPNGKRIVTGTRDISLYKMKNQQLRVIRSSRVIIISIYLFFGCLLLSKMQTLFQNKR